MKKKNEIIQILLFLSGVIILLMVYVVYPKINSTRLTNLSEENILENKINEDIDNNVKSDAFLNVEYQGFYQLTNPFALKAKEAKILSNDSPDLINMKYLNINISLEKESWIIECDSGHYNKSTYDIYCEGNVTATNGETKMTSGYLNLVATEDAASIRENVVITDQSGSSLTADSVDYNFETKKYRVSMYPGKKNIEIQLVNN